MIMFEEWDRPGEMAPNVFFDYRLQYKLAFALGFRPEFSPIWRLTPLESNYPWRKRRLVEEER